MSKESRTIQELPPWNVGHVMLETVMFVPFAFVLLLAILDIGTAFWHRSRLLHVVQESLRETQFLVENGAADQGLFSLSSDGSFSGVTEEKEAATLSRFGQLVMERAQNGLLESKSGGGDDGWIVEGAILVVEYDASDGSIAGISSPHYVAAVHQRQGVTLRAFQQGNVEDLIEREYRMEDGLLKNNGALAIRALSTSRLMPQEARFQTFRSFFVISIDGQIFGLGGQFLSPVFPGIYSLHDEVIENVRDQVS